MSQCSSRGLVLGVLALSSTFASPLFGQTFYGNDAGGGLLWEFTAAPGGACGAPNPIVTACPFTVPMCGVFGPGPGAPPPGILGDVAYDSMRDAVYVTDGKLIGVYVGDTPCGVPPGCTPLDLFSIPTVLLGAGFGPITGMGFDEFGFATGGFPTLYITDGRLIAGLLPPPPPCSAAGAVLAFGPCLAPVPPGVLLTDLTIDPLSASLWACDDSGTVTNIALPTCVAGASFPVPACGLGTVLQGIAFDTGSGRILSPGRPALFVTDGFAIEAIDVAGAIAAPTFYSPITCSPTPAPLNGLAFASHGITYGTNRVTARCGTFGASTTPSATFGLEYSGAPAGTLTVLLVNTSVPGPGYFCGPVFGLGTSIWVDPSPPGFILVLGPSAPGCVAIPLPIPAAVPTGLNVFTQWLFLNSSLVAVDATEGCSFTIDSL